MDFLAQARLWAAEAAGLSEQQLQRTPASPPPVPQAPLLSRTPPQLPSLDPPTTGPPQPRTLNEAILRTAQSEARALALQTALDRYVAQGEVMEVRAGGCPGPWLPQLQNCPPLTQTPPLPTHATTTQHAYALGTPSAHPPAPSGVPDLCHEARAGERDGRVAAGLQPRR